MKYEGSCHCGNVAFDVELVIEKAVACNCSICQRKGSLLVFAPKDQFHLNKGQNSLKDYQFGKKSIHHYFCTTCGVTSFAEGATPDGKTMVAVNVRCLEGIDIEKVPVQHFNGRAL